METRITFQKARRSDQGSIRRLVWKARLNPSGLNWRRFTVGFNSVGEVVACVQVKPHRDGSQELASVVVSSDYRGMGVARMMLEHVVHEHDGDLYLMCRVSLGGFYQRFGFKVIDEGEMLPHFLWIFKMASFYARSRLKEVNMLIMKRDHLSAFGRTDSLHIQQEQ